MTADTNPTDSSTSKPDEGFDYMPIVIEIVTLFLALILWAILRWCVFRKALKENPGGPTSIHTQTNAAINKQQGDFSKNGGQPNQPRVSREQHEKNMKKIRKVIGDEEAKKLEAELEARGLELDAEAVDKAITQGGPDVAKIMMRERCGFNEAVKIAIKEQTAEAMKNDPEMAQRLKDDPELAQQALENGAITKSQYDRLQAEGPGPANGSASPAADGTTSPAETASPATNNN